MTHEAPFTTSHWSRHGVCVVWKWHRDASKDGYQCQVAHAQSEGRSSCPGRVPCWHAQKGWTAPSQNRSQNSLEKQVPKNLPGFSTAKQPQQSIYEWGFAQRCWSARSKNLGYKLKRSTERAGSLPLEKRKVLPFWISTKASTSKRLAWLACATRLLQHPMIQNGWQKKKWWYAMLNHVLFCLTLSCKASKKPCIGHVASPTPKGHKSCGPLEWLTGQLSLLGRRKNNKKGLTNRSVRPSMHMYKLLYTIVVYISVWVHVGLPCM